LVDLPARHQCPDHDPGSRSPGSLFPS